MADIKEKLIEFVEQGYNKYANPNCEGDLFAVIADHLIANGVTVQQWISVKDRLPNLIPCSAGTGYSEAVNVLTEGRKVLTAIWDGTDFIADADFWDAEGEKITHWTPVLLPLPELPEEGEM